jgi:DMSO/TMAO reductase YedYZ molybdopterin-dependent catalytic subunit
LRHLRHNVGVSELPSLDRRTLPWVAAGLVAGAAGMLTSYAAAMVLTIREAPVVAIAELVVRETPGPIVAFALKFFGHYNKSLLLGVIAVLSTVLFALVGRWARERWWLPVAVYTLLAVLTAGAIMASSSWTTVDLLPVAIGYVTWLVVLSLLTEPLRRTADPEDRPSDRGRREFLIRAGAVGAAAAVVGVAGRLLGSGRRHVEETRRLLRLPVRAPRVPAGSRLDIEGISDWQTPSEEFYQIHTAIVVPAIEPEDWSLRIHGMVEREVVLTYQDLLDRQLTDAWVTLCCVSNPVGGPLVGNAWWSGVRVAELLAEAGVLEGADAVLQTSEDGWNCATPLAALTDDRDAMLAVAMNGSPLPIEHGFPVRTVVPGLYGYVSATKWVVDMEVTRFADVTAYWTERGWGEQGPVKTASRIDVPRSGSSVTAGSVQVGGVAWHMHTGISTVEVSLDGGPWQPMELGRVPSADTWVQWGGTVEVGPGDHLLRVRATDGDGVVQTPVERDVLPDGATGHDLVDFTAQEA